MERYEEKILSIIAMVLITLFLMPVVGVFMICRKESTLAYRIIGIILLLVGVVIMQHVC